MPQVVLFHHVTSPAESPSRGSNGVCCPPTVPPCPLCSDAFQSPRRMETELLVNAPCSLLRCQ